MIRRSNPDSKTVCILLFGENSPTMETNTKNREEFQRHVRRKNQDRKDSHPLIKMELPPADPKLDSTPGENAKTEKEEEKSKPFVPLAVPMEWRL